MIFTDDEAITKFNRIHELQELYDLNLALACTRVGIPPSSFSSLKKRVERLKKEQDDRSEC